MRYGSLCTGIGGLDLAVEAHWGAEPAWVAEYEEHLDPLLQRHFGPVLNLRDLTTVDWADLEPVDVLTAGYPCQPFSHAGLRKGTDDHRHLWPHIADAIRVLRPRHVVLENVAGHLSLGFDAVLADLAEAGFDAEWCLLRASDVGACHQRARLFIVARNTDGAGLEGRSARLHGSAGQEPVAPPGEPPAADSGGQRHGGGQDPGAVGRVDYGDAGEALERERPRPEPGDRSDAAPTDADWARCLDVSDHEPTGMGARQALEHDGNGERVAWGQYEPAIIRWEHTLGRPAPRPTDDAGRLSPAFVEWMQGYPPGWVDGLTRTQALKALGNAVVPQQAIAALAELAPIEVYA